VAEELLASNGELGSKELMGLTGYLSVCMQIYCVGFDCFSLHVSVYRAIFKYIGYFIFICLSLCGGG
jgi:hypothetical protein